MTQSVALKRTPLHSVHVSMGARMVDFGGWDMPVQYSGVVEEHHTVRKAVGLFDVSHMGEIEIRGPGAVRLVDYVTSNAASNLQIQQAQYSGLLYEHGGFVDDILVHKVAEDQYFLCVNAANQEKDFEHIRAANRFDATVEFASDRYAQIAVQGPLALRTLEKLTTVELGSIAYYWFKDGTVAGAEARIARTGYTGAPHLERASGSGPRVWNQALRPGRAQHTAPGSKNGAIRPRDSRFHHAVRSRAGLDRQTG
jgi:aminomethyltransferase